MRILFLNWRDIRSPRAGGAEVLTHEIARRLVEDGHGVDWLTSRPDGLSGEEDVDGVRVRRRGSELTTRLHAPRLARSGRYDVVVEEINTLPWLAPLWWGGELRLFIPQLAREVWWYEAPRAVAPVGHAAEPLYLAPYRGVETVTISRSTLEDLRALGFRSRIHVIPMATSAEPLAALPAKEPAGRLAIVGRLVPSKRVDHALRALAVVRRTLPEATLAVVGDGPLLGELRALALRLGVEDAVEFTGRVGEERKAALLQEADALVATAVREGWGLTVTEAAQVGTPAVAYRIPGLRDSIVDGRTGVLTDETPEALAAGVARLLGDRAAYERVRVAAWRNARELDWRRTASAFAATLRS